VFLRTSATPGDAPAFAINTAVPADRRATQRERIHRAMLLIAAQDGYANTTIAKVIAHAGVSRPTFYEYFPDRDACFMAVLQDAQEQMVSRLASAVDTAPPERALHATVEALVEFAATERDLARVALNESLAGGAAALQMRETAMLAAAQRIEARYEGLKPATPIPDAPSRIVIGGVQRLLAGRLRAGEVDEEAVTVDLRSWIDGYLRAFGEHRWRTLERVGPRVRAPSVPPLLEPAPPSRGRPRLSKQQTEEIQRQRILYAAARVSQEKGYAASTIAEITRSAGVDGRAFHRLFATKEEVFVALYKLQFQQVMAVAAGAFFKGATWPARVWEAGRAFGAYLQQNQTLAHAVFIESYAGGPITVRRIDDALAAFTIFLQEGRQQSDAAGPSEMALRAIAACNFEMVYHQARAGGSSEILDLLPNAAHLTLAPFLGVAEADRVVDELSGG
jgi:AcrR family transcriptional regulator